MRRKRESEHVREKESKEGRRKPTEREIACKLESVRKHERE